MSARGFAICFLVAIAVATTLPNGVAGSGGRKLNAEEASAIGGKDVACSFYLLTTYCTDQPQDNKTYATCGGLTGQGANACKGGCTGCQLTPVQRGAVANQNPVTQQCLSTNVFGLNLSACATPGNLANGCGVQWMNPTCQWAPANGTTPAQCTCTSANQNPNAPCPLTSAQGQQPNACTAVPVAQPAPQ